MVEQHPARPNRIGSNRLFRRAAVLLERVCWITPALRPFDLWALA
jgi:hypothetical protein